MIGGYEEDCLKMVCFWCVYGLGWNWIIVSGGLLFGMMDMIDFFDDCIEFILGCIILWDVIWLVSVCFIFKRVMELDVLWLNFLFSNYKSICGLQGEEV